MTSRDHLRRMLVIWLVSAVVITPLVVFVFAPIVPPGQGTVQSSGQVLDNTILFGLSTPVALFVLVYFGYALIAFRERDLSSTLEGAPIRGHAGIQTTWVAITTVIVLFLAGYASYRMLSDGVGAGQGPNPIATPSDPASGPPLQVQVIGQQWAFTYRFPGYGGVETPHLELPANRLIEFHVTSVDVIHSFWAYQLGVKADANPGVDNIAYVETRKPLSFDIHCVELCGVWHGYMYDTGKVVSGSDFASWIAAAQRTYAPATKLLDPYSKTYFPDPQRRGG
jgi:cytochrome c oxidase subunit 2